MSEIKIKKSHLRMALVVISVLVMVSLVSQHYKISFANSPPTKLELTQQYASLISLKQDGSCGALGHTPDGKNLVGSCCGKMRKERYVKQRSYLNKYANNDNIPKDPWNVPASLARELTAYGKSVRLTPEEQKIYDGAFEIFDEGPCCCKCWRWSTFDGLAKKMIKEEGFSSQQIAELWASEDVCGDEDPFSEIGDNN